MKYPDDFIGKVINNDCLEVLEGIPNNSVDAIITDPPAGIAFMGKKWDKFRNRNEFIIFIQQVMTECYRVLKPGAHAIVWALPKTSHWTAMGVENAGFEIRDVIHHIFTSGFPKSLNIEKALQKRNASLEVAEKFKGMGSSLKPACEHWILARKPLSEKTIVENELKWETGGIDIDGTRIPITNSYEKKHLEDIARGQENATNGRFFGGKGISKASSIKQTGRFPANVIVQDNALDDGEMVKDDIKNIFTSKEMKMVIDKISQDIDSKSRYFDIDIWAEKQGILQISKTSRGEKGKGLKGFKNTHPTVKPIKLLSWLIKLVSKEGDIVLDPFIGSGTTAVACILLKRNFIGIEKEEDYCKIAEARINRYEGAR